MTRITSYIDGFNLYHAIADLHKPHLKWVDLWALCESIAREGETLTAVKYFSAYATWLPGAHQRHLEYIKALQHCGVSCIMGHFKEKERTCKDCGAGWVQHEEKETDVHIAARLVADAYENRFDRALLITADSDLAPALDIVRRAFPKKHLFVVSPPNRHNHARSLNPRLTLTAGRIARCLLPETATDPSGKTIFRRPTTYIPPR